MSHHPLTLGLLSLLLLTPATVAQTTQQPPHLLTLVQGNVQIRRANWLGPLAQFRPVSGGTVVNRDDRLKVAPEARAIVICSNLSQWQVPTGQEIPVSQGCGDREQRLYRPGSPRVSTRTPNPQDSHAHLPYIFSPPSNSKVMTGHPSLRWNPVAGAQTYRVQIGKSGGFRWETEVSEPTVVYDGEPLQPGARYWLIVATDAAGECSRLDFRSSCLTHFSVLSASETQQVQAAAARIQATLDGEAAALMLAHLYRSYELYGDAIAVLETYRQSTELGSIAVDHLLADLYAAVDRWQRAEALYLQVLEHYRQTADLDGEVAVLARLTALYAVQPGPTDAKTIAYQAQLRNQRQALGIQEPALSDQ